LKLRNYLAAQGILATDFAKELDVHVRTVRNWLAGTFVPMKLHQKMIEDYSNGKVTSKDWKNASKKETNRRVRSGKDDGVQSAQCVGTDKKAKPKSSKAK